MNAAEIQPAEMQSTVGRDCRESLPSRVCERLDRSRVICDARSGACRDGRRTKGCLSCVAGTRVVPRCTRTRRNWMSGGARARAMPTRILSVIPSIGLPDRGRPSGFDGFRKTPQNRQEK
jgi:hypothetical protein